MMFNGVCKGFKYVARPGDTKPFPVRSSAITQFVRPPEEQKILDTTKRILSKWEFAIAKPAMVFWFWWTRK